MARTLSQILTDINAVMDLEASEPTGDELTTRVNYANQVVWDASAKGQISEFKREYLVGLSGSATVSLPADFRELQENPRLFSGGEYHEYVEINIEQKYEYAKEDENKKYCYVMGDAADGYTLFFNNLLSGATLSVIYQRFPSGFATLTDVCELSDPQVVVKGVESYVLYSRSDDRFPIATSRYETQLSNMMGREMKGPGGQSKNTPMKFNHPLKNLTNS